MLYQMSYYPFCRGEIPDGISSYSLQKYALFLIRIQISFLKKINIFVVFSNTAYYALVRKLVFICCR